MLRGAMSSGEPSKKNQRQAASPASTAKTPENGTCRGLGEILRTKNLFFKMGHLTVPEEKIDTGQS